MQHSDIWLMKVRDKHFNDIDKAVRVLKPFSHTKASYKARWLKCFSRYENRLNKKCSQNI